MLLINQQLPFKIIHYPYLYHFYKENNIIVDLVRYFLCILNHQYYCDNADVGAIEQVQPYVL